MLEDRGGGWFVVVLGKVEVMGNGILVVFYQCGGGLYFCAIGASMELIRSPRLKDVCRRVLVIVVGRGNC